MTAIYLGELCFPLPPETLTLSGEADHRRVALCDLGEITQLGSPKQLQLAFSGFFPAKDSPLLPDGAVSPGEGASMLRRMLEEKKPVRFVAAGVPHPLSLQVTVESLRLWEEAGDVGSVHYALRLQEYRTASSAAAASSADSVSRPETRREETRQTPSRYTVVKGDTLWGIARRFYGDGSRYTELARKNNLSNPNLIYPGQVIVL